MSFDPANWLISAQRTLEAALLAALAEFLDPIDPADAYDIVWDWPDSGEIGKGAELKKTIVHFVIDDIDNRRIGIGDNQTKRTETLAVDPIADPDTVTYAEGGLHEINFDVGVWASDLSGGSTARLVVYQMLYNLFGTEFARRSFNATTEGVEILRFNGGRFITDRINDVRVFRIIDSELVARVYSGINVETLVIVDKEPEVDEILEIDGSEIS